MARLSMLSLLGTASLVSLSLAAFDEAGIIQLIDLDRNMSTPDLRCLPKGADTLGLRYFAILKSGSDAFMSTYNGKYFSDTDVMRANLSDSVNATLKKADNGQSLKLKIMEKDKGKCVFRAEVVAGTVLGIHSNNGTVLESGIAKVNVTDTTRDTPGADCTGAIDDIQDAYAFVRTETMVVLGGLWGTFDGSHALLMRSPADTVKYDAIPAGGGLVIATNSTVGSGGARTPSGCVFPVSVLSGSVLGASAGNTTTNTTTTTPALRGANKAVCRQTCGARGGCRTVCRDIWV